MDDQAHAEKEKRKAIIGILCVIATSSAERGKEPSLIDNGEPSLHRCKVLLHDLIYAAAFEFDRRPDKLAQIKVTVRRSRAFVSTANDCPNEVKFALGGDFKTATGFAPFGYWLTVVRERRSKDVNAISTVSACSVWPTSLSPWLTNSIENISAVPCRRQRTLRG
ncbi:hypothetical protein GQ53DRAFT_760085 [Thozetella sp. PMI_491]|nr:hypothetical protein GQ53DRAFT_760085 [Thozetella sp. PMI_491]